ncbi:matrixin family metalloprotease [Corallococcus sp. BB11-1]|uniref:matrixin family metalloprotease n=1 Tax=Corallococcus sp. BB11-1 TaxID=2996783 RepID=UPI00226FACCA|nr:matrixin family metalloprotease [Corallococcus sp. BB11-1]MCY1032718.1 matrixin family metalloprotease [Corallococcus sp. BB11-1]
MPLALLGLMGCAQDAGVDEVLPAASQDAHVKAWVPETPVPTPAHAQGTEHTLSIDWILQEKSVEALTDHSALIINGRVESTRYDVIRTHAQSKTEGAPSGEAGDLYTDLPVTIATVRIDDLARSSRELQASSGGVLAQGATVDVMFPGGLLADGCLLAPEDNPLPRTGEQAVFFLTPQEGARPLAAQSLKGVYAVTGGPVGRVLVQGGFVQGSGSTHQAAALQEHVGGPVTALLERVGARARAVEYVRPEARAAPSVEEAPRGPTAQSWCGVPLFGYKWCRYPTNVSYTDFTTTRWPVGDAMNAWMYTSISNGLYLHWRGSGSSDVMVYENWYGTNGWYAYTWNYASGGCMTGSIVNMNNTYHAGAYHAKSVAVHEIGHTLGIAHHWDCNSIMYSSPTVCGSAVTSCDAQVAAEMYRY